MIGLDTNVLVRYVVEDDADQFQRVKLFLESNCTPSSPGYISDIVLCELVWVLQRAYRFNKQEICNVLDNLLGAEEFCFESEHRIESALAGFRTGAADFADHLISLRNISAGCVETVTLDRRAGSTPGMRAL